jgi:hypothetical protein
MNLDKRLRKLESARRIDASGFVPRSEAWFTYWEDILDRNIAGEDVECAGFPLEVIDRVVAAFDANARTGSA